MRSSPQLTGRPRFEGSSAVLSDVIMFRGSGVDALHSLHWQESPKPETATITTATWSLGLSHVQGVVDR